jgi:hypothetical protein
MAATNEAACGWARRDVDAQQRLTQPFRSEYFPTTRETCLL